MRFYRDTGFTIVELLVTVAIIGLLTMVAYPSYQRSVLRANRADGIAAALAVQVAQEKFRANCPFYAQTLGTTNTCGANAGASTVQAPTASPEGLYTLSIVSGTASGNSYTIAATPTDNQAADTDCSPLKITFNAANPNGLKEPADCW